MNNKISRRSFLSGSAAALATASIAPIATSCQTTPVPSFPGIYDFGSKFGGVQIGAITYSWRNMPGGLENIIKYCKETGINSLELMSGDLEAFLGAPSRPNIPRLPRDLPPPPGSPTPVEIAAMTEKYNADVRAFRAGVTPEKVAAAKKMFDDAGIIIHTVKYSPGRMSDEDINYAFNTAKLMGAKAVSDEMSEANVKRLAPFAEKHGMYASLHNHDQFALPLEEFDIDELLSVSPAIKLNFDVGHYYGSTGLNPCDILRKYHDHIYSVHLKDLTGPEVGIRNDYHIFGQGQTPLEEVLLLIKKEGWPMYVDVELEYPIKPWSNQVKETKTCVQYSRNILI